MTRNDFKYFQILLNSYVNCQHDKNKNKSLNSMSISYYVPQYQGHEFLGPFVCGIVCQFLSGWCSTHTKLLICSSLSRENCHLNCSLAIHRVKTGHVFGWLPGFSSLAAISDPRLG